MTTTVTAPICPVCSAPFAMAPLAGTGHCAQCGGPVTTRFICTAGHVVCDHCLSAGYVAYLIEQPHPGVTDDPVATFLALRAGCTFPLHGPEHHGLVTAAFLLAYRHAHAMPAPDVIASAIRQAALLPMGTCGLWGACSAGLGIGIAVSAILDASPKRGIERAAAHQVVAAILQRMGEVHAPRCCRRETLLALITACALSSEYLPHRICTSTNVHCEQSSANPDCTAQACPFQPVAGQRR